MNGALFLFSNPEELEAAIAIGGYSPRFQPYKDKPIKWQPTHRSATADLVCLQPKSPVYLFSKRGIHGIGVLAEIPVVLNGSDVFEDNPSPQSASYKDFSLPVHRLVVRFNQELSEWFTSPVDMDDVLTAGGSSMYALRTMEMRSFIIFDEAESAAFEREVRLANLGSTAMRKVPKGLDAGAPLNVPEMNLALRKNDELAMETDLLWRLNSGNEIPAFGGKWDAALRQVTASPAKPVVYIDRIDILARRFEPLGKYVKEHAVIELKWKTAEYEDAVQMMRYVDWVVSQVHHGRYDRIQAFLVAPAFSDELVNAFKDVTKRMYIINPRKPESRLWIAAHMVIATRNSGTGEYEYEAL